MTVTKAAIVPSLGLRAARACCLVLLAALMALGCEEPEQDSFRYQGGASPDPTGIIEGSVAYLGPQPTCEYKDGKPSRVIGRVILTLFVYANPSPPEGRATSAENLLSISGDKLFSLEDCLADGKATNPAQRITRSVQFRWTAIPLKEAEVSYQIRGFYDYDEDMVPFFSVTRLPTQGDIAGGAVRDFLDVKKGFQPVDMPSRTQAPDGFVRSNITVGLNQYIWTERPAFELSENRALRADWAVPVRVDLARLSEYGADARATLLQTWALTCADGEKDGASFVEGCGFTVETLSEEDAAVMAKSRVEVDVANEDRAAIYANFVDVKTIKKSETGVYEPDVTLSDGKPDPHPVLGTTTSLDINWYQPIVLIQRTPFVLGYNPADQQNVDALAAVRALETSAAIPSVSLVGAHLPAEPETGADVDLGEDVHPSKSAYLQSTPVVIPPVAVVDIDPTGLTDAGKAGLCRVPYIPFGGPGTNPGERTTTRTFESRLTDCQDLPAGVFGVNVLSGVAGGTLRAPTDEEAPSDTGKLSDGSRYSGQSWSLPNEIGNPGQVEAANVLPSQGWDKLFIVHDPDPEPSDECTTETTIDTLGRNGNPPTGAQVKVTLRGLCEEDQARIEEDDDGVDGTMCMDPDCCAASQHLCGVPLCDVINLERAEGLTRAAEDADPDTVWKVRGSPTKVTPKTFKLTITQNGVRGEKELERFVPDCIPFPLPSQCCQ